MAKRRGASLDSDLEEDRISMLPDSLIHHIMSFMDTKYAVQTCVLSKRWKPVWKSVPVLNFNRCAFARGQTERFKHFVYMVFMYRDGNSDIQKFSVDWMKPRNGGYGDVNRWSLNAVKHNVQEISIVIKELRGPVYEIPEILLNCKSLRKLVIEASCFGRYVDVILPRSMNLPQLKGLVLEGLKISDAESSKRFLSSCPILETLLITDCGIQTDNRGSFVVDSVSLKKFDYICRDAHLWSQKDTMAHIKLCAPNLDQFYCVSFSKHCRLENCSPLSKVFFKIFLKNNEEDENANTYSELPSEEKDLYVKHVMQFIGAVYMVKHLSLSPGFVEVLSRAPDFLDCQPPRLYNLKYLKLGMWSTRGCIRALVYLLGISPNIEEIYFMCGESKYLADVGDDWEAELPLPGTLSHIKYVQIYHAEGSNAEFKLLSFVLKNAKVLNQVDVYFRSNVGSRRIKNQIERFKKKLRALPTASSNVAINF